MMTNYCLLAVTGGSASGKTRLAQAIAEHFAGQACYVIPEDDYYVDAGNLPGFDPAVFNFDEPAAKQHDLLAAHLDALRKGQTIDTPQYDFATHCRCEHTVRRSPARVMIVEGLHLLTNPTLAAVFDLTVFVDASDEIRFKRRLTRDVAERDRTPESVYHQFETLVRPMHDAHVEPQKDKAHLVIENMGQPDFVALAQPVIAQVEARLHLAQSA